MKKEKRKIELSFITMNLLIGIYRWLNAKLTIE